MRQFIPLLIFVLILLSCEEIDNSEQSTWNIIENKIFDASTSGEYIDKNKNIEVVENEGSSIKVKQIT